jgi:hypothetical protein
LFHRAGFEPVASQVAVPRIAFQQALAFQRAADAQRQGLGQSGKLGTSRRLHPTEPQRAVGMLDVHPVEAQHMKVDIEVQRTFAPTFWITGRLNQFLIK